MSHCIAVYGFPVFFVRFSICQLEIPSFVPLKYFALNFIFYNINTALLTFFGIFDRVFFSGFFVICSNST